MSSTNRLITVHAEIDHRSSPLPSTRTAALAWIIAAAYYFYQYALRSAPSVMMPQLSESFGLSTVSVASIVGIFYYGYSPFSLVAGAAMDRLGPRKVIPIGAAVAGLGAILFGLSSSQAASIGRFLQGAGGVFAPVGAIYIASTYFPASKAATLIGATQMFGMAGGAAGQFAVGSLTMKGLACDSFWLGMGIAGIGFGVLLFLLLPAEDKTDQVGIPDIIVGFVAVFKNPQSILCGLIAGLLFIPTTIFDMIWGVRYLQEAHSIDYGVAVLMSATVPFGWIIGCPLLGFISDRIHRRKPVILGGALLLWACIAWILFGSPNLFPPYTVGLVAGIASGAAMLPYTVIKETNAPELSGTATGVVNFLNFTFSALLAPVFAWILHYVSGPTGQIELRHYQQAFALLLVGVAIAIALTFYLKETGAASNVAVTELKRAA